VDLRGVEHLNGKLAGFRDINVIPFKLRAHFLADNVEHLIDRENMQVAIDLMRRSKFLSTSEV
jgi:hypothetical protein